MVNLAGSSLDFKKAIAIDISQIWSNFQNFKHVLGAKVVLFSDS